MAGPSFLLVSNKWVHQLYGNLDNLRQESVLCDVTLQGNDNKNLLAHSCVLASASNVLKSCLTQAPRGHYVVKIPSISSTMWELLISFIYKGQVAVTGAQRNEMVSAAQMLGLSELQSLCETPIANAQDISTLHTKPSDTDESLAAHDSEPLETGDSIQADITDISDEIETKVAANQNMVTALEQTGSEKSEGLRYSCNLCGKTFPYGKSLHIHELLHKQRKNQARHKCSMCNKICATYHSLRAHERTHTYQPFKCHLCDTGFHFQVNYDLHMKKKHNFSGEFKCEICEKEFCAKGLLNRHMTTAHHKKKLDGKGNIIRKTVRTIKRDSSCGECGLEFRSKEECLLHFKNIHCAPCTLCTICNRAFLLTSIEKHLEICKDFGEGEDGIKCPSCDKVFKNNFALKCHTTEMHNPSESPICEICSVELKSMKLLAKHMKNHEGQIAENLWRCSLCNAEFENRPDYGMHIAEHRGEKTYNCKYCGKGFTHKGNYSTHVQRHLGIKPFSCEFCKKTFVRKDDLKSHLRVHTGEKPFGCQLCQMKFSCISNLREHERSRHNTSFSKRNPNITVPRQLRDRVKYRAKNVAVVSMQVEDANKLTSVTEMTEDSYAESSQEIQLLVPASSEGVELQGEYYQVVEDASGVQTLTPVSQAIPVHHSPVSILSSTSKLQVMSSEDIMQTEVTGNE